MDRRKMAGGVISAVVVASVGGFLIGRTITSPGEVAARTAAPEASLIFVPVEERVLSTDIVTRGTGRFGSPQKLTVASSALKTNPGLVAEFPLAGAELAEGQVAVSASGRPLFVLAGARPMSRDLGPGLTGEDVKQLEEALVRLGFPVGTVDDVYDDDTQLAVASWYEQAGFTAFAATPDQLAAIRQRESDLSTASIDALNAQDQASAASAALVAARAALAAAVKKVDNTSRAVDRAKTESVAANGLASTEVASKQGALDAMKSGGPAHPATTADIALAEAEVTTAEANVTSVKLTGDRAVTEAQTTLNRSPAALRAAKDAAVAANDAAAADIAVKQAVLDDLLADPTTTPTQIASATADVGTAKAAAETARITGEQSVANAQATLDGAQAALDSAVSQAQAANTSAQAELNVKKAQLASLKDLTPATAAETAAAERDLATAKASAETTRIAGVKAEEEAAAAADEARSQIGVEQAAVSAAEAAARNAVTAVDKRSGAEAIAEAAADLAKRQAGVQVPADEVVFVATTPVKVKELLVGTGDPVTGAIMTVTDAKVFVDGSLAVADAALVKPGMTVKITEPDLGIDTEGTVRSVATGPGTNGVDGFHVYFEVQVDQAPLTLPGASARLTIPVESSGGKVLTVPVSALTLAADNSSRVQKQVGTTTEFVTVKPGLSAKGFVAVTPTVGELKVGDMVVIGSNQPNPVDSLPVTSDSVTTDSTVASTNTADTSANTGV